MRVPIPATAIAGTNTHLMDRPIVRFMLSPMVNSFPLTCRFGCFERRNDEVALQWPLHGVLKGAEGDLSPGKSIEFGVSCGRALQLHIIECQGLRLAGADRDARHLLARFM